MRSIADRDAEIIRGLVEENQNLKVQLMEARTVIQQLELGTLVTNARLLALRFGKPCPAFFNSPLEKQDKPLCYEDAGVRIIASTMTRSLDVRVPGSDKPVVRIAWDGSVEAMDRDFSGVRAHIRDVETKVQVDLKRIS
jgi:hypothetical protein